MKTVEEIFNETYVNVFPLQPSIKNMLIECCDKVSKEYAKQVAEQGLKDAANNMKVKLNLSLDDYLDIVETPIQLP